MVSQEILSLMELDPFEIDAYVGLVYGPRGSGKTTAVVNGPGRKGYMELDIGSLARAANGLDIDRSLIDYYPYRLPPTSLRDMGRVSTTAVNAETGKGAATIVHNLKGWDALAFRFTQEFCDLCEDYQYVLIDSVDKAGNPTKERQKVKREKGEELTDICIDTSTIMWDLLQDGTRERIQRTIPESQWEKELKQLEFEEPNSQVWMMCNYAKSYRKNLIFTAAETYPWKNSGADRGYDYSSPKPDGNKYLPGWVDFEMRMSVETIRNKEGVMETMPVGTLTKIAAGGYEVLNMTIQKPTVRNVILILKAAARMRKEHIPFPSKAELTADYMLAMAKDLELT